MAERAEKPLTLNITQEWFEKHAPLEGDLEIMAGSPIYLPGFIPSAADRYYNGLIAGIMARYEEIEHYHRYFVKLAKVNAAANAALDTARREWAKKAEG